MGIFKRKARNYFIISPEPGDGRLYIEKDNMKADVGNLMDGKPIEYGIGLQLRNGKQEVTENTDFVAGITMAWAPTISTRFKSIIEELGESNIQFFPVEIECNGCSAEPYWHMHILNTLEAFDWDRSTYLASSEAEDGTFPEWDQDSYRQCPDDNIILDNVSKYVFLDKVIRSRHIFRFEASRSKIIVSDAVVDMIQEKLVGIKITPL